jgi:hypothetical protein
MFLDGCNPIIRGRIPLQLTFCASGLEADALSTPSCRDFGWNSSPSQPAGNHSFPFAISYSSKALLTHLALYRLKRGRRALLWQSVCSPALTYTKAICCVLQNC